MKKIVSIAAAVALTLAAAPVFAQSGHESMGGHDMKKMEGARHGTKIREAKVDAFKVEYYLIDMKEMAKSQEHMGHEMGMAKMKSHHLMTYVTAPEGKAIVDAKVGYVVVDGGGAEQKAMAMAMDGGYGADVELVAAAPNKVTVKIVAGASTLIDEFTYPVAKK